MSYEDCIDVVREWVIAQAYATIAWVQAQGYLTTSFVERGDPGSADFAIGDFTIDSAWHDLDLSGIVPSNAKAVAVSLRLRSTLTCKTIYLTKKDYIQGWNVSLHKMNLAGLYEYTDKIVPIGSDGKLTYYLTAGGWNVVWLTVKGWWL